MISGVTAEFSGSAIVGRASWADLDLGSSAEIRALQTTMQRHALYAGPIDGSYAAGLRAAIAAYESAHGMMVTGLATQALLRRLKREHPSGLAP